MRKLGEKVGWGAVYRWDDHVICLNGDSYAVSQPYGQDLTWIGNQMGAARKIRRRWFLATIAPHRRANPQQPPQMLHTLSASMTSGIVTIFGISPFWTILRFNEWIPASLYPMKERRHNHHQQLIITRQIANSSACWVWSAAAGLLG